MDPAGPDTSFLHQRYGCLLPKLTPNSGRAGSPGRKGREHLPAQGGGRMEMRPTSPSTAGIWGPQAHTLGLCEPRAPQGRRHFLGTWAEGRRRGVGLCTAMQTHNLHKR